MNAPGPVIATHAVRFRYPGSARASVTDVTVSLAGGELVCLLGPNGSGKTTLLRMMAGTLTPTHGSVTLEGRPAHEWGFRERARRIAVVAQREEPAFPLRVRQTVMLGRHPHIGTIGAPGAHDRSVVEEAMRVCDITDLADRWVTGLSGGEWQRVRIARALAQEPRILMLDEATANLDVRHEMEAFELTANLVRTHRLAGLMVTHHVNLAARFADRVVVMREGHAAAIGAPAEVLTEALFESVFQWPVERSTRLGVPQFVPIRTQERESNR